MVAHVEKILVRVCRFIRGLHFQIYAFRIGGGFLGIRSLNAIGHPFYCFGSLIGYLTALKPLERIEIT